MGRWLSTRAQIAALPSLDRKHQSPLRQTGQGLDAVTRIIRLVIDESSVACGDARSTSNHSFRRSSRYFLGPHDHVSLDELQHVVPADAAALAELHIRQIAGLHLLVDLTWAV